MDAEVIKDFLISLGFQIDDAGSKKFGSVIAGVTANVFKMAAVVEGAALTVTAFTAKIASGLDNLYWASQRTGATVQGIQQIGYAVSQMGGSVDGARSSLESLSRFMRNSPGAESFLNRLGIQTRDAKGNMRDMATVFTGVGQKLSGMSYSRANQYAQMLGIDENTLLAMRRGLGNFSAQYSQMTKAIGYNADTAAVSANKFMTSLHAFGEMAGMARDKIGSNLAEGLAGSIDSLRKQILDNFPKIEETITRGIKGLLWLADVIGRVVFRLIQAAGDIQGWWKTLDAGTQKLIATFGGLLLAWRILNSAFLASPIGIITALIGSLVLLYDDYKTWKEGGKSLIDWGKWEPEINSALDGIDKFWKSVKKLKDEILELFGIDPKTWSIKFEFDSLTKQFGELSKMLNTISALLNAINEGRWSDAASLAKQLITQGSDQPDALPGVTAMATQNREWLLNKYFKANDAVNSFFTLHAGNEGALTSGGLASGQHATASGSGNSPRGIRNNNPGNIDYRGQAGAELERPGGRFARFSSAYDGLKAMANQLMRYFEGKTTGKRLQTLTDIISTWAPGNENNTSAYIDQMSKQMGIPANAILNLKDPQVMSSLMNGIIHHENGRNPYSSDLVRMAASGGQSVMPGNTHNVEQNNTYNIYGGDPKEISREIGRNQVSANAQFMRTNQSGRG